MYLYDPLVRRVERGVREVECELSFFKVDVAELLFGIAPATTDQLLSRLDRIDQQLDEFRAETAWAHREFLKRLRRQQARVEAVCPSIFTLIPASRRINIGINRLELRLYCEQPGAFHPLGEQPYIVRETAHWLQAIRPYLTTLIAILKHTIPMVSPVLGITSEKLAKQLENETDLMQALVSQMPATLLTDPEIDHLLPDDPLRRPELDVDYRLLHSLLQKVDPTERWAGLSRIYTPEDQVLWLCKHHARPYVK